MLKEGLYEVFGNTVSVEDGLAYDLDSRTTMPIELVEEMGTYINEDDEEDDIESEHLDNAQINKRKFKMDLQSFVVSAINLQESWRQLEVKDAVKPSREYPFTKPLDQAITDMIKWNNSIKW